MPGKKILAIFILVFLAMNIFSGSLLAHEPAVELVLARPSVAVEVYFEDVVQEEPEGNLPGIQELLEKIDLYLVLPPQYRADFLIGMTQKPLVPSILEEGPEEITIEMLEDYLWQQAITKQEEQGSPVEKATIDFDAYAEVLSKMEMVLSINLDLLSSIKEKLPEIEESILIIEDNLQTIRNTLIFIYGFRERLHIKEDVVLQVGELDSEEYGNGELLFIQILAQKSQMTVEDILRFRAVGLSWSSIAEELGISLGRVAQELNQYLIVLDEEVPDSEMLIVETSEVTPESLEENISDLLRTIKESKEKDLKKLRQELEKAKEKLKEKQEPITVPALVEDILKNK